MDQLLQQTYPLVQAWNPAPHILFSVVFWEEWDISFSLCYLLSTANQLLSNSVPKSALWSIWVYTWGLPEPQSLLQIVLAAFKEEVGKALCLLCHFVIISVTTTRSLSWGLVKSLPTFPRGFSADSNSPNITYLCVFWGFLQWRCHLQNNNSIPAMKSRYSLQESVLQIDESLLTV